MALASPVLRRRKIPGPPPDPLKARLLRLYVTLARRFGPQRWWPARTSYEVAVGAILTQHTAWTNAARAIGALRARRLLRPERLAALPQDELAEIIRSAGTYRLKARRLQAFTRWLLERFAGRFDGMRRAPLAALRREMLGIVGLGPETVDAILLYAAARPAFVADAYARRLLAIHGLLGAGAGYEDARAFLEAHLPSDPALFNEFHALMVAAGKERPRSAGRRSARRRRPSPPRAPAHPSPSAGSAGRAGRARGRRARRR
jgi:endonuclease III related protein